MKASDQNLFEHNLNTIIKTCRESVPNVPVTKHQSDSFPHVNPSTNPLLGGCNNDAASGLL